MWIIPRSSSKTITKELLAPNPTLTFSVPIRPETPTVSTSAWTCPSNHSNQTTESCDMTMAPRMSPLQSLI